MKKLYGLLGVFVAFVMIFSMIGPAAMADDPEPTPTPAGTPIPPEGILVYTESTIYREISCSWEVYIVSNNLYRIAEYVDGTLINTYTRSITDPPPDDGGVLVDDLAISQSAVDALDFNGDIDPYLDDPGRTDDSLIPVSSIPLLGPVDGYYRIGEIHTNPQPGQRELTAEVFRKKVSGPFRSSPAIMYSAIDHPLEVVAFYSKKVISALTEIIPVVFSDMPVEYQLALENCEIPVEIDDFISFCAGMIAMALAPEVEAAIVAVNLIMTAVEAVQTTFRLGHILQNIDYRYNYIIVIDDKVAYQNIYKTFYWTLAQDEDDGEQEFMCFDSLIEAPSHAILPDGSQGEDLGEPGQLGSTISDIAASLLSVYKSPNNHIHEYTDDNDCICNICLWARHNYPFCQSTTCLRCGLQREPFEHDFEYVSAQVVPIQEAPWGHAYKCSVCGFMEDPEFHTYSVWESIGAEGEERYCTVCQLEESIETQPHVFDEHWAGDKTPEQVCAEGGIWQRDCINWLNGNSHCGYQEFINVPAGHIDPDGDGICNRCGLPSECWNGHHRIFCTDTTCSICHRPIAAQSHDNEWVEAQVVPVPDAPMGHALKCNTCGFVSVGPEFHTYSPWESIGAEGEERYCTVCQLEESIETQPHVFDEHWAGNKTPEQVCAEGGIWQRDCINWLNGDSHCGYQEFIDVLPGHIDNDGNSVCDRCGCVLHHVFSNCMDTTCDEGNCRYERPAVSGYLGVDGHVYDDCYDPTCNRCSHTRTVPAHYDPNPPTVVNEATADVCQRIMGHCAFCGETYTIATTTMHIYNNCADEYCNTCYYYRPPAPGILYPDGHVYDDCFDDECNVCHHIRTVVGHYDPNQPTVTNEATADVCQRITGHCVHCGATYTISTTDHSYSNCGDEYCNTCNYHRASAPGILYADGHVYTDCLDGSCNRSGCSHTRTPPGHYDPNPPTVTNEATADVCQRITGHCVNCGATYTISTTDHIYSNCDDEYCNTCNYHRSAVSGILWSDGHVYTDCTDTTCNRSGCGHTRTAPGHTYTNCGDLSCNVCGSTRSSVSGTLSSDGHVYTDCADTTCNRCGHVRTAPGHYDPNPPTIVTVGSASVCQRIEGHCVNCGATYTLGTTNHIYTDCTDAYCNTCNYQRTPPGHSLSYGSWQNVGTSSTCRKRTTDCVNPGCPYTGWDYDYTHSSYTYGSWTDVATSSTCEKRRVDCNDCTYYYYQYDYTHSYPSGATYYSSTQHYHTCSDCGYRKYEAHHFTALGGGYLCTECGYYTYTP